VRPTSNSAVDRLLSTAAVVVTVSAIYGLRVADADLWGHLTYGRWFAEHGLPKRDPFSYATEGQTWYTHEYLSQMILWWSYAWAGPLGLVALKGVLGGATLALVYRSLRLSTPDSRIWAPVLMLAACLLGGYLFFRPQLFTYALFAAFVFVLLRSLLGQRPPLWLLPLCMVGWVNVHGGFVAGIGIVGMTLCLSGLRDVLESESRTCTVSGETRALAGVLALCLVASLVSPLGWRIWSFLRVELGNAYNQRFIAEWQPARLMPPDWIGGLLLGLLALLSLTALAAHGSRPGRLPPSVWVLSVLPLAALAIRSHRHVPLITIWAAPVLALLATAALRSSQNRPRRFALLAVAFAIGCAGALELAATLYDPLPRIHRQTDGPAAQPAGAASFWRANALDGRLYCPLWWGSYLTWELYPRVLVSSDGRNDTVYPIARIGENLLFYATRDGDLEAPLRDGADFLLTPARAFVSSRIRGDSRWVIVYEDSVSALFVRNDEAHQNLVQQAHHGLLHEAAEPATAFLE